MANREKLHCVLLTKFQYSGFGYFLLSSIWLFRLKHGTSPKHGDLGPSWPQTQSSSRVPHPRLCTFRKGKLGWDKELSGFLYEYNVTEVSVHMIELVISWFVTYIDDCQHSCLVIYRDRLWLALYCRFSQLNQPYIHTFITTHLPPPPRVDIQNPCILQSDGIVIHSRSDQQLGVLLSIVETASSMVGSLHWPRGILGPLQCGPLLRQVPQYMYIYTFLLLWLVKGTKTI